MPFDLPLFTLVHVIISVVAIIAGLVVVGGLMSGVWMPGWTALFLATTIFTSVSGFLFPISRVTPAHIVGALSLGVLAICVIARYVGKLEGRWRPVYVVTAVIALYLNVFVLVVQLFAKTPPLAQLAPTQQEPPFAVSQTLVLALFVWLGWSALRGVRLARALH